MPQAPASSIFRLNLKEWSPGASYVNPGPYLFEIQKGIKIQAHQSGKGQSLVWPCKVIDAPPGQQSEIGKMLFHRTNATLEFIGFTVEFLQSLDERFKKLTPGKEIDIDLNRLVGMQFGGIVEDNTYTDPKTSERRTNSRLGRTFSKAGWEQRLKEVKGEALSLASADILPSPDLDDDPEL